jgi:hypothetical protein
MVCILVGSLGNTGFLASPVRPLAAEKSTKNRHFSTFYVLLFLKI